MPTSTTSLRLTPEAAIDLQLHTVLSDGDWTPEALLTHLRREGFGLGAITDHDRVDPIAAVQQLARDIGQPLLVAVEMSCAWRGGLVDLLCYGFDPARQALHTLAEDLQARQRANTQGVVEALARQGCVLPAEALSQLLAQPSCRQLHALVALLKAHGYGHGEPSAGRLVLEAGGAYVTHAPAAVVAAAHADGGVCLIAHPGRTDGFVTFDPTALDQFRLEAAIDGLEVHYPAHTPAQIADYTAYAERHQLLMSAGSDSHNPVRPPIKYPAAVSRGLLERLGIEVA